jgi:hypothetical protein
LALYASAAALALAGLALVVLADAVAVPLIVRARQTGAALEQIVDELDPHESVVHGALEQA